MRRSLPALLAAVTALLLAAPATAIVGGEPVSRSAAPWFVGTGICGGTLVAPDRVVTAAHCLDPIDMRELATIRIGREARRGVRVALPSTWRERRAGFVLDDVAIVALDRPVTSVRPAAVAAAGQRLPARVTILGRGQTKAPAPGDTAQPGLYPLRRATLDTVADADCAKRWQRSRTKYRTRFVAASDICAIDRDGRRPLDSVCAGDSGGPMIAGTLAEPVLLGVISWTGPRCGADKLPSVAVDAGRFRDFILDPAPVWAPAPAGSSRVAGDARVGGQLTCELPAWEQAPDRIDIRWLRRVRTKTRYRLTEVATGATYTAVARDAGQLLECEATASTAGGRTVVPPAANSAVRVR